MGEMLEHFGPRQARGDSGLAPPGKAISGFLAWWSPSHNLGWKILQLLPLTLLNGIIMIYNLSYSYRSYMSIYNC